MSPYGKDRAIAWSIIIVVGSGVVYLIVGAISHVITGGAL